MREIKFRAWNGSQMSSNVITIQELANKDFAWDGNKLVWLQFTGLIDKNGKEIYEGDIVKWHKGNWTDVYGGNPNKDLIQLVEYLDCGFEPFTQNEGYGGVVMFHYSECEVIGNIYENPELISQ